MTDPARTRALRQLPTGHPGYVSSAAFRPAIGGADGTVVLWDVSDPAHAVTPGQPLDTHADDLNGLAFGAAGFAIASGDRTVQLAGMDQATSRIRAARDPRSRTSPESHAHLKRAS